MAGGVSGYDSGEYLDGLQASDRAAMWARFLQAPRSDRLHVVTLDDYVVRFACFGTCPDSVDAPLGWLFAINLDPHHWGRGLGRALLSEVMQELVAFGDAAVLWVVPENIRARGLYETAGWVDDGGRRHDDVLGVRVDECGTGSHCARSRRSPRPPAWRRRARYRIGEAAAARRFRTR